METRLDQELRVSDQRDALGVKGSGFRVSDVGVGRVPIRIYLLPEEP